MNENLELLNALADKLGVATSTLVEWFAIRSWTAALEPVIWAMILAIGIPVFSKGMRIGIQSKWEDELWPQYTPRLFVGGVFSILGFIGAAGTLLSGIQALVSPNAYAVEQILRLL